MCICECFIGEITVNKLDKEQVVKQLKEEVFTSSGIVIVSHNKGLTVAAAKKLRNEFRRASCKYKVTKNSLTRIAAKGTSFEALNDVLTGPTSLAFASDPVTVSKLLVNFTKENEKLQIVGGVMDGKFIDAKSIQKLATLPSLDELRGKIVGLLQAPATKLAVVIQAPAVQIARVLKAYSEK